ncbi:uncharacterized protein LOC114434317 [Parambassis ranga]|uniref:Uncharacterized protein LOC114434317 n=1 Tax=Parambassis ranga TaxID=210632 RepID=A0A6P7I029_9TELE|nr:uncharacterized protein LOC114434317 [Parambassis ranga]
MMNMWLNPFTLLLTVAAVLVVMSSEHVFLNMTEVEVPYGSPLDLHCSLNTEKQERYKIAWYFSDSPKLIIHDSHLLCDRTIDKTAWNNTEKQEQDLKTCNLRVNQTKKGWYFCSIDGDIPVLVTNHTNGTEVVISKSLVESTTYLSLVTSKQVPPTDALPWMWIAVAGSSFIMIVLLVVCIVQRRRCHRSREEEPVYVNAHPPASKQPSPRLPLPVNNLKTASSTQNLRTPSSARRYEESQRRPRH